MTATFATLPRFPASQFGTPKRYFRTSCILFYIL